MNKNIRKTLSTFAYLAFLVTSAEIALQAFYYYHAGSFLFSRVGLPIFVANEYSGIFNRPNLEYEHNTNEFRAIYYTNGHGFRVSKARETYSLEKPPGSYRVMLLGPSFAFGWAVDYDKSFTAVLKTLLEEQGFGEGRNVEIINAGVPSLAPAPHLNWYKHVGVAYKPDLVIQLIYGSMTVANDLGVELEVSEDGYLIPRNQSRAQRVRAKLKNFATVFYAWNLYTRLITAYGESTQPVLVRGAGRDMSMQTVFDPVSPSVTEAIGFYNDLQQTIQGSGTHLLVVYFPLSYAIHREDTSRWKHLGVVDIASQSASDEAICHYLNSRALPCLDITKDLQRAAADGTRLYFYLDIHWTEEGNSIAAAAVAARLQKEARARLQF